MDTAPEHLSPLQDHALAAIPHSALIIRGGHPRHSMIIGATTGFFKLYLRTLHRFSNPETCIQSAEVGGNIREVGCEAGRQVQPSWLSRCPLAACKGDAARLIPYREPGSLRRRGHAHFRLPRLADDLLRRVPLPR